MHPIGHAGGLNLYEYTTNPVNVVDPMGLRGGSPHYGDGAQYGAGVKHIPNIPPTDGQVATFEFMLGLTPVGVAIGILEFGASPTLLGGLGVALDVTPLGKVGRLIPTESLGWLGRFLKKNKNITDDVFGPCPGNTKVSLKGAAEAASRNGIDMRMIELRYIKKPWTAGLFGSMFRVGGSNLLFRGQTGKIVVGLTRKALSSPQAAVNTIAHELNHIRGVLKNGIPTGEDAANFAGDMAERYFK